jgi:WD40 repeat protein
LLVDYQFGTDVRFHPVVAECLAVATSIYSLELKSIGQDGKVASTRSLRDFADMIGRMAFSEDGSLLAAASYDGTTCAMKLEASDILTLENPGQRNANVAFVDEHRLLTGTLESRIQLWKLGPSVEPIIIDAHAGRSVTGLGFLRDGHRLVSSGSDGSVRVWDIASCTQCDQWYQPDVSVPGLTVASDSQSVAWEAGGVTYFGSCTNSGKLRHAAIPTESLFSSALAISPAGNQLAIVDFHGLRVVDTRTGEDSVSWSSESITCVSFHPSRSAIAAGSDTGQIWRGDLATGQFTDLLQVESAVSCLTFSADGEQLAIGCADGDATITDYHQPTERISLRGHAQAVRCLAFTPDGTVLATGCSEGDVRLWDPVVGAERSVLRTPSGATSLAFSSDSRELAAGGNDGVIRIWKTDSNPTLKDAVAATGASSGSGR